MKKLLIPLVGLLFLGAGCLGFGSGGQAIVGDWWLNFSLPQGWVVTRDYRASDATAKLNTEIDSSLSDLVIQSTDKLILTSGQAADLSGGNTADQYINENYTAIRVFHLDARSIVPSEAEDIGDGFKKLDLCATSETCTYDGSSRYVYYFETGVEKFKFTILQNGQTIDVAESTIKTAQLVTAFTEDQSAE
ncbi:MAG: hypothetical protein WC730_00875 [Patescibacteria group bacterium]|jgi:hypothetical protein